MVAKLVDILTVSEESSSKNRGKLDRMMANYLSVETARDKKKRHEAATQLRILLAKATLDLKQALAEQLLLEEKITPQFYLALAHDEEISVAGPIIENVRCFEDEDWDFIIDHTSSAHWSLVARRGDLSDRTLLKLIEKKDETTLLSLLDNATIMLDSHMLRKLKHMSFEIQTLQMPLSCRSESDTKLVAELYWTASHIIRDQLIKMHALDQEMLENALEKLGAELINLAHGRHHLTPEIQNLAKRYATVREITPLFMNKVLKRGHVAFFIALLAERTGLSIPFVQKCVYYNSGRHFAVLCKAFNITKSDFASYFLLTRKTESEDMKQYNAQLSKALVHYDDVGNEESKHLVFEWRLDQSFFATT